MATKIKNKKMLNSEHLLITHQKCQKQFKLTKRETATLMVNYSMNQDSSQQQNTLQEESSIITKNFQKRHCPLLPQTH
jgi:DNA-binding MarR family transcriptional regulator